MGKCKTTGGRGKQEGGRSGTYLDLSRKEGMGSKYHSLCKGEGRDHMIACVRVKIGKIIIGHLATS